MKRAMTMAVVLTAAKRPRVRIGADVLLGSLAAGLLASTCCIGPLIGLGSLGFGAWLAPARVQAAGYQAKPSTSAPATDVRDSTVRMSGQWRGRLKVGEGGETSELTVDLDRVAGAWTGQFDLPGFGVEDYPVSVALAGRTVTLELPAAQIEFVGELDPRADLLAGVAETRGHRDSLVLRRVGNPQLSETFRKLEALSGDSSRVQSLSVNGEELRSQFNEDRAYTRLVMLLSPT